MNHETIEFFCAPNSVLCLLHVTGENESDRVVQHFMVVNPDSLECVSAAQHMKNCMFKKAILVLLKYKTCGKPAII